jgi:hypothetical protein
MEMGPKPKILSRDCDFAHPYYQIPARLCALVLRCIIADLRIAVEQDSFDLKLESRSSEMQKRKLGKRQFGSLCHPAGLHGTQLRVSSSHKK